MAGAWWDHPQCTNARRAGGCATRDKAAGCMHEPHRRTPSITTQQQPPAKGTRKQKHKGVPPPPQQNTAMERTQSKHALPKDTPKQTTTARLGTRAEESGQTGRRWQQHRRPGSRQIAGSQGGPAAAGQAGHGKVGQVGGLRGGKSGSGESGAGQGPEKRGGRKGARRSLGGGKGEGTTGATSKSRRDEKQRT